MNLYLRTVVRPSNVLSYSFDLSLTRACSLIAHFVGCNQRITRHEDHSVCACSPVRGGVRAG